MSVVSICNQIKCFPVFACLSISAHLLLSTRLSLSVCLSPPGSLPDRAALRARVQPLLPGGFRGG